ncbi:MAG: anti-sigma factor [bacterium]|nr:anti-sigma factor [bacterium]
MNCNTCRYELSQCLDGRLPSGRRAVVMQHLETCEACAEFWEEMQAAQRLTLQLPRESVGANFRDGLWERIRAGEGTPDAMFHEPVPVLAKVRYALTGAAAAAATLLFGLWLYEDQNERSLPTAPRMEHAAAINDGAPENAGAGNQRRIGAAGSSQRRIRVTSDDDVELRVGFKLDHVPMLSNAQPLNSVLVAQETARQLEQRYASVDNWIRQLPQDTRGHSPRRPNQQQVNKQRVIVERILGDVNEFRALAEVLLELRDHDRLSFRDPKVGTQLELATHTFQTMGLQNNLDTIQRLVAPTVRKSPRLSRITDYIAVTPAEHTEEREIILHFNRTRPEVFGKLFIHFGQPDALQSRFGLPNHSRVLWFQGDCGPNYVLPRSIAERVR